MGGFQLPVFSLLAVSSKLLGPPFASHVLKARLCLRPLQRSSLTAMDAAPSGPVQETSCCRPAVEQEGIALHVLLPSISHWPNESFLHLAFLPRCSLKDPNVLHRHELMKPPRGGRGIPFSTALSAQPLPAGLSLFHSKMPSGPGDLRNMCRTHIPPFRVQISVCLTDVFHQDLTRFALKGAFFVEMTDPPNSARSWGRRGSVEETVCLQGK